MVVTFGGINVDGVLTSNHLPRRGETVVGAEYAMYPGGKGANQAAAAALHGASVTMAGCVGEDHNAQIALDALKARGVSVAFVERTKQASTAYASVWVDRGGENQIIVASGANFEVNGSSIPDSAFTQTTTLLIQLEVPLTENETVVKRAGENGARVILNAAPYSAVPDALFDGVDVLVVNEIEAQAFGAQFEGRDVSELAAAEMLAKRFGLICIVTLGGQGAMAFREGKRLSVGALPVKVVDTTGAGDAFVGTLAAALDEQCSLEQALRLGATAGSLACTRLGAQSGLPTRKEVYAALPDLRTTAYPT